MQYFHLPRLLHLLQNEVSNVAENINFHTHLPSRLIGTVHIRPRFIKALN